jgi:hypothetical protein
MRRIFAILLICLFPLQSFAGVGMGVKMVGMTAQMADAPQAPCHQASQPMQAVDQDCCGSQAMCHSLCQMATSLPTVKRFLSIFALSFSPSDFVLSFQSADLRAGSKPPIL